MLGGIVEADEAYVAGKESNRAFVDGHAGRSKTKPIVFGMVERKGRVITKKVPDTDASTLLGEIRQNVDKTARLITDNYRSYKHADWYGYDHDTINHSKKEYAVKDVHTNTIEGYWGQLKRSIRGTYVHVSKIKLPAYLDEFAWNYNVRFSPYHPFSLLMKKVV